MAATLSKDGMPAGTARTRGASPDHSDQSQRLRLLMVEDSEDDAELIRIELEKGGYELEWTRVDTEEDYVSALREQWDLVISDFQMPQFDGLRAFALYKARKLEMPFLFVSGVLGEDRAVEAMRAGARDYLLKGDLARLGVAVKRELAEYANRRAQASAKEAARREQRRLAMAVEASGAGVFEFKIPPDRETYLSDRWAEILGYQPSELPSHESILEWVFEQVHADDLPTIQGAYEQFVAGHSERYSVECRMHHANGSCVEVGIQAKALERSIDKRAIHVVGVMLDLTERRKLEAQLRQAQKMEAIGRLAGGVAHDFNNILTAIQGFGDMVLQSLHDADPIREDMQELLNCATRAETLTGQLLAFSRRQPVSPRVINPNQLIVDLERMLGRVVGEDVSLETSLAGELGHVRVDPGSLEQVIVNIAVNARDAMPDGGTLTIETENSELQNQEWIHAADLKSGHYVAISISDDGIGMDEATRRQIFEPFFTTKEAGRGTGLGLSTCYGIVKQAGGYIWVYSEPGLGTTFRIYLPRVGQATDDVSESPLPVSLQGTETILVAEDDDAVRRLVVRAFSRHGYRVVEASNGFEALTKAQTLGRSIDLLITDVVMPEMNGKELARCMKELHPGMKLLYTSGYTPHALVDRGVLEAGIRMVRKPFKPDVLVQQAREVLDT